LLRHAVDNGAVHVENLSVSGKFDKNQYCEKNEFSYFHSSKFICKDKNFSKKIAIVSKIFIIFVIYIEMIFEMADGYLEKRMEEFSSSSRKTAAKHVSLDALLERNRSCRGYDKSFVVRRDMLERIVNVNTKIASGKNQQLLRFKLVTKGDDTDFVLKNIKLGGMLPELHLPYEGTEPEAFIVVCTSAPETKILDIDLGISLQSMALKATEMGLNCVMICAFNKTNITEHFNLKCEPLAILAVGKGAENIKLKPVSAGDSLAYYRADGVHYVPKLRLDDIII